jgi:hypothetical protein
MVLFGRPAMGEAVRTTASTFGIWAIVVVAVVCLAVWLVGISVADNMQARESRRWWRRLHAPESVPAGAGVSEIPGQRRDDEQAERSAVEQQAAVGQEAAVDREAATEPIPAQGRSPELESESEAAAARGRHARPTLDGTGDFRRDSAEADWRTEAPTRPDLPAQPAPTGRHAMPMQRTGNADRAERSLAGQDAAREDEDPESR